jgi:hypothetical protein
MSAQNNQAIAQTLDNAFNKHSSGASWFDQATAYFTEDFDGPNVPISMTSKSRRASSSSYEELLLLWRLQFCL